MSATLQIPVGDRTVSATPYLHQRAISGGDLVQQAQYGQDLVTTALVLATRAHRRQLFGDALFRRVPVPAWTFEYLKYDASRLQIKDARRGLRAPFETSDYKVDKVSGKLVRYGWATEADRDEVLLASAVEQALGLNGPTLPLRERKAADSKLVVERSIEKQRAAIALAAASYSQSSPDLDTTIATNSEWNHATNGDSRSSLRSVAEVLAAVHGVSIEDIDVVLSIASFHAAQNDPTFVSRRGNFATEVANAEEIRSYWGVKSVTVGDSIELDSSGAAVSMYGDVAVLRVSPMVEVHDPSVGELDSFVDFRWAAGEGVAIEPFYDADRTTWRFPWEGWSLPVNVNTLTAAIIRNTSATV